jgi:flagellar protein FliL
MSQAAAPAAEAGKKKGKGKLLIILVATLVLALGGGGAAYFFMGRGDGAKAKGKHAKASAHGDEAAGEHGEEHGEESDEAAEGEAHEPAVVALPTVTVNLADKDATRYLRTTVSLLIKDTEKAATLSGGGEHKAAGEPVRIAMARSAILELLTTKTAEELMSAEGKTALKKEIAARASQAFRFKVNDVLLAEFVVQ